MPRCNATYKAAIKFINWMNPQGEKQHVYWHPLYRERMADPFGKPYSFQFNDLTRLSQYWAEARRKGSPLTYEQMCTEVIGPCERMKSPVVDLTPEQEKAGLAEGMMHGAPGWWEPKMELIPAYHFDATRLAEVLKETAVGRGVKHVLAHVGRVEVDERRWIQAIHTESGERLDADLFIDCTGFRGLLINQTLETPFLRDSHYLLCDSALALQVPHPPDRPGLPPYTACTGLSSGWAWEVPLYHRDGTGYVYSSQFISREDAEKELREFLGPRAEGLAAHHINIRVGRNAESWVNNCIAIGLSSSFLEPLESPGIYMIEFALQMLLSFFPDRRCAPALRSRFNEAFRICYEEVRDFIILHYCLTDRTDTPFWAACREAPVPDSLKNIIEFLKESVPLQMRARYGFFEERNYACIAAGMGLTPKHGSPLIQLIGSEAGDRCLSELHRREQELLERLPDHRAYLQQMHERAAGKQPMMREKTG